jgi:hypothetical protein
VQNLLSVFGDDVMVAAVGNSPNVPAPPQSKSQSKSSNPVTAFQQSVDHYLQNATSGVGGPGTNPSQTLSSDLISSLLQMQQ